VKSMASSKNMAKPIMKYHEAHHWLLLMSGELSHRLINARAESHGLWPKTLSLFASKGNAVAAGKCCSSYLFS
jgi:DNA polymerase eta